MVRIISSFLVAAATAALSLIGTTSAQVENDNPNGKVLYVNYPSCDSWKCQVIWHQGDNVHVNWLLPPSGSLKIELAPQDGTTGLKTYTVRDSIKGTANAATCDHMGTKEPCGRAYWTVPDTVKPGQYQIVVTSISHPKHVGYTDTVVIKKKPVKKAKRHEINRIDEELN